MILNLVEKLILLSLDNDNGKFISHGPLFNTTIAGATIAELIIRKKIRLSEKLLKVSNTKPTHDKVLDYALEKIYKSNKEHSISHWIVKFSNSAQKSIDIYVQNFIDKKILIKKESKVLWVFNTTNFPTKNSQTEDLLRLELNNIIIRGNNEISIENKLIIGLISVCDLNNEVYGKSNSKERRKRIKGIINSDDFVKQIIDEIEYAYTTFVVVITTVIT
ncbi:MAG: GPP34 family phosphoprotein [Bacteroidales bacterium]|nr:GPP34 family phosphoprotein [Bacteroidales bacterium]